MKTPASNLMPFAPFTGLPPLHKLDQKMMRRLRKLADQTGWTVERCIREAIADFVAKHPAEEDAPAKLSVSVKHTYEIRPRKDKRGFDLVSTRSRSGTCGT